MKQLIAGTALLALAACAAPQDTATEGVLSSNAAFEAAFNAGDAATLAGLYTVDAVVMAPNLARIEGRRGIQELWQNFFDAGVSDIDLETLELEVSGDRAAEVGRFSLTAPDGKGGRLTGHGKYIVLWLMGIDGVWRLHRDIWNNDPKQ